MFQTRFVFFVSFVSIFFLWNPLLAQTETKEEMPEVKGPTVTVTAHRYATPNEQVGSSVTILTAADLQRMGVIFIADALRTVAGLDVVQNGGIGRLSSVFIRGGNSGHTLFLLDGVEMADSISTENSFDLGNFTVDQIDRIEIVRGPQSTLYGSDALGGVVHIITRKGAESLEGELTLEGGSYGTLRQHISARGGSDRVQYSVSGSHFENDGFSTASSSLGNQEEDGYRNSTLAARLDIAVNNRLKMNVTGRHTDAKVDLDNAGGVGQDDPNFRSDQRQTFLGLGANWRLLDNRWNLTLHGGYSLQDRKPVNPFDEFHPEDSSESVFESGKSKWNIHNDVLLGMHRVSFGAETELEEGNSFLRSQSAFGPFESEFSEEKARTTGFYLQDHIVFGNKLALTLGARLDDHDRFGSEATYRTVAAYPIEASNTLLRGSYGTGFKAPSLFQLFSSFGNQDLNPEESEGWDVGFEQGLLEDQIKFGITYFANELENLIDFSNETFAYDNIARAQTRGFEAHLHYHPLAEMQVALNVTLLDTEDKVTQLDLLRRPEEKLNLSWTYAFSTKALSQLDVRYVGEREDVDFSTFPSQRIVLDDYVVVNLAGQFQLWNQVLVKARIENLLDEEYEDVLGYGTPGFSGYLGFGLSL